MVKKMPISQIMTLKYVSVNELVKLYKELYGEDATGVNKTWLWRKIAYKLQELEYGGLSVKSKTKLKALIEEFDPINNKILRPDKPMVNYSTSTKDKRLPIPGTMIIKEYKGANYQIKVLEKGFEFRGKLYKTLSSIAKEISGCHWNGFCFLTYRKPYDRNKRNQKTNLLCGLLPQISRRTCE